jgi:hypothetical protein
MLTKRDIADWSAIVNYISTRNNRGALHALIMTSIFSQYLRKPMDSPEHQQFRAGLWLGGSPIVCRYYLSILTGRDFFDATNDEFVNGVRQYVVEHACPAAVQFCVTQGHLDFVLPFLKQQLGDEAKKPSKEERALVLLVQHPDWTDSEIREAVATTDKAMKRWSTFKAARAAQTHYKNRCPGWY